jgi:hypothetical protein
MVVIDMKKRSLVFRKVPDKGTHHRVDSIKRAAVSKRHPMYGALKGLVCVAPGTDLTEPADPEWGKNV